MYTLESLEVANVKGVKFVRLDTAGMPVITVGGRNGQGKSSLLDSIQYTIGGKDACCAEPIRNGENKAGTLFVLKDHKGQKFNARCKWSRSESGRITRAVTLSQQTEFGEANVKGVQAILDSLFGGLQFDPMEFSRLKPKDRVEQLKSLAGLDTSESEAEEKRLFDERTDINRRVRELEGQVAGAVTHADAPETEVSVAELMAKIGEANRDNRLADELDRIAEAAKAKANIIANSIDQLESQLAKLKVQLIDATGEAESAVRCAATATRVALEPLHAAVSDAEGVNRKVRDNNAAKSLALRVEAARTEARNLSDAIDKLRVDRQVAIESAKWPIQGLGFKDGDVSFDGIPFDQVCQSGRLKVGMAIAIAMNPGLRIVLMRDASLLDDESRAEVERFCVEHECQAFLEVVGDNGEYTVIMENGEVRAREPAELETAGV